MRKWALDPASQADGGWQHNRADVSGGYASV